MSENRNLITLIPDKEIESALDGFKIMSKEDQTRLLHVLAHEKYRGKNMSSTIITLHPRIRAKLFCTILLGTEATPYLSTFKSLLGDKSVRSIIKSSLFDKSVEDSIFMFLKKIELEYKPNPGYYYNPKDDLSQELIYLSYFSAELNNFCEEFMISYYLKYDSSYYIKKYKDFNQEANLDAIFRKIFIVDKEMAFELAKELNLTKYLIIS